MRKVLIFLLLSGFALAADHAPLPKKLFEAKTIYIDNRSGYSDIADKVYSELKKWNRFQVVASSDHADLVFLLGSNEGVTGYSGYTQTYTNGAATTSISPTTGGETVLKVIDLKDGSVLWTERRTWHAFGSATKSIVKELRKRMEEQERR